MRPNFVKSKEKKRILVELEETYGINKLPYLLIETGKRKLRAFSGDLSKEEIIQLTELTNIEVIGMYIINQRDDDLRLNFDAITLFRDQITRSILEINKEQLELWLRGHDLEITNIPRGIIILKYQEDFVGLGKSNEEKIFNYIPKERKLKTPLPKQDG